MLSMIILCVTKLTSSPMHDRDLIEHITNSLLYFIGALTVAPFNSVLFALWAMFRARTIELYQILLETGTLLCSFLSIL